MSKTKIAIILRGVPGSGKSTFVNMMRNMSQSVDVHAIDDLHVDPEGNFLWDEENADRLYTLNFANFVRSCASGTETVVCDAINIETDAFQKYIDIANQYDYRVYVVTPSPPTASESTKRNKHHTSSSQAREMYSRWQHWPTPEMLKELSRDDK